jgi:HEAT repeat protein
VGEKIHSPSAIPYSGLASVELRKETAMLERLEQIDWYSLGHAYGDAADVPRMIRALTSPDQAVRGQAWEDLFGSVRHQGSVYDATPKVVPFLIELLDESSVPTKAELLEHLCYYAPDYGYWSPYNGDEPVAEDEYTQQTRQAIEDGMPVFVRLLGDPDSAVRSWAARLLTVCFSRRGAVALAIRERLPAEPDAEVRTVWALQLGILNRSEDAEFFAEVALRDRDPVVRLAAALAWVLVNPNGPPDEAVRIIEESTKPPADLLARLPQNEWVVDCAFTALRNRNGTDVKVLLQLLQSPTAAVRQDALQKLASLRPCPPEALQGMVQALADPVADVRQCTAFLFGEIWGAGPLGRHAALANLKTELDEAAPAAVAGLAGRLTTEGDEGVRAALCRALKSLALWAGPAVPALQAVAAEEHDAREALDIIEKLQRGDAKDMFRLAAGHDDQVSWMAGRVLVRAGRTRPDEVIPLLIEGLESWPAAVEKSANLLGELRPAAQAAIPALEKALSHGHQGARNAAAEALRAIAPATLTPQEIPDETEIRRRLGEGAPPKLVKLVKNLLNDASTNAQLDALWKIGQMGAEAKPAVPFVREAMQKTWLRPDAAGALGRLDPESVRPMIPNLLRPFECARLDGDFGDRTILFLAYLGPELQPDAVRFLLGCLPEPGDDPRPAARMIPDALPYLTTAKPEILLPLVTRLLETRWESQGRPFDITAFILKFLKKQGAPYAGATPAVLAKLQSTKLAPLVLETLSRIGSWSTVLPHLGPLLAGEGETRHAAEECVRRLGKAATKEDLSGLRAALAHESAAVRRSTAAALKRLRAEEEGAR